MTFVVAAKWRAREGEEETIREILETFAPLAEAEPGCRVFLAHQSTEDPRTFFLYEQYDDEASYQAHTQTEHVEEYVRGQAVPRLEIRERDFYVTLD